MLEKIKVSLSFFENLVEVAQDILATKISVWHHNLSLSLLAATAKLKIITKNMSSTSQEEIQVHHSTRKNSNYTNCKHW